MAFWPEAQAPTRRPRRQWQQEPQQQAVPSPSASPGVLRFRDAAAASVASSAAAPASGISVTRTAFAPLSVMPSVRIPSRCAKRARTLACTTNPAAARATWRRRFAGRLLEFEQIVPQLPRALVARGYSSSASSSSCGLLLLPPTTCSSEDIRRISGRCGRRAGGSERTAVAGRRASKRKIMASASRALGVCHAWTRGHRRDANRWQELD